MKLTLLLGVMVLVFLCVVEETSAHAGNTSMNKINKPIPLTPKEIAKQHQDKIAKKKAKAKAAKNGI